MKTRNYVYGVQAVDGFDAWSLFKACGAGDIAKAKTLLADDPRLVNAQFWYQQPIHLAVRAGRADLVKLMLDEGADPGESRFLYNSWDKLLLVAQQRGHVKVENVLTRAMKKRFRYSADFRELKDAIMARSSRRVGAVLHRQPSLAKAADAMGNNAIHWSVLTRQLDLIPRFVAAGTPIDAPRADGQTSLLLAVSGAHDYWYRDARGRSHPSLRNAWVIVGYLLASGARFTISAAAAVGDQQRVEELLQRDRGLARRLDSSRLSPLSYAAREGHSHIVQLLLQNGADPNQPEDLAPTGRSLFEACGGNHLDTARLLLEHDADPNAGVDSCGCCLTIAGHHHGRAAKPLQQLLRDYGAHTPPYAMSTTEMKQAIRLRHGVIRDEEFLANVLTKRDAALLEMLLEADPAMLGNMQAYGDVAYPSSPKLVRILLERGMDPNRPDWLGKTFLHACAENGDRAISQILLDAGAVINARELEFNGTPLAAAVRHESCGDDEDAQIQAKRRWRVVEFLLKRGAATNLPGDQPWATPLSWARKRGLTEIERLLLEHGAK